MHEMAIMQSILEIAEGEAHKHGSPAINRIKLKIGDFRGVVKEALEFSFEILRANTLARNAILEIETVRLGAQCPNCGVVDISINNFTMLCPHCGAMLAITAGREMQIEYLDLE